MSNIVFFWTSSGIETAEEFIRLQDEDQQQRLRSAAEELSRTGQITNFNASHLKNGHWSIWLNDKSGELCNFRLYTSPFVDFKKRAPVATATTQRKLVIKEAAPGRPGDDYVWTDAAAYIKSHFSGRVRDQLLAALERALTGLPAADGSVEIHRHGVTLRAVSDSALKGYDAQVDSKWDED